VSPPLKEGSWTLGQATWARMPLVSSPAAGGRDGGGSASIGTRHGGGYVA